MPYNESIKSDIYKIDPDRLIRTTENTISVIIDTHNNTPNVHRYESLLLMEDAEEIGAWKIQLFINRVEEKYPDWFPFVYEIASPEGRSQLVGLNRKYPSFLLFIYNKTAIYVVCKGGGRFVISDYILQSFGVEVLERLIDHSQSDIHSLQERGVIGDIVASDKHFKPDHKFSDEQSFGKFYKSVKAQISRAVLQQKLGHDISRPNQIVGGENTLKISSSLNLEQIIERITRVDTLINDPNNSPINKFAKLSKKQLDRRVNGISLKESLETALISSTYSIYATEEIELYHPLIFEYLVSESIQFTRDETEPVFVNLPSRITLQFILESFNLQNLTLVEFSDEVHGIEGGLLSSNSTRYIYKEPLTKWLVGEIEINNRKYFKFDGEWFSYRNEFINEINSRIENLLNKIGPQETLLTWDINDSEGEYNKTYRNQANIVVCDKVLYKGIEICDFLKFENGTIKLYHVKKGLGESTRVVYNQIMNAARFIAEIQNQSVSNNIIDDYYKRIEARHYDGIAFSMPFTQTKFRNALRKSNVTFTLVYGSERGIDRDQEVRITRSNIAKLSLIECENILRANYSFGFSIAKTNIQ